MIRRFEEVSMNAWPALQTIIYDGWVLRFANGITRRSNSINPIYNSFINIDEKISVCEKIYSVYRLPVIFKMTSESNPANLDYILNSKGYIVDAETSFQVLKIDKLKFKNFSSVEFNSDVNDYWILNYIKFNNHDENKFDTFKKILNQIITNKCLLQLKVENNVIGCGLGVLEDKFFGLFDIVVNPDLRGRGFGKIIVESILSWGISQGAETAYLQVMLNNPVALGLYEKIGFKEEYKYWYRVKKM